MNIPKSLLKPALAKIGENLRQMIADSYNGPDGKPLTLQEGESDFCTLFYETNRGQQDTQLKCIICTMDSRGKIVRFGLGQYDFQANVNAKMMKM